MQHEPIAIASLGLYLPARTLSAAEIAARAAVSVDYVENLLGIRRVFTPGDDDHAVAMSARAAKVALARAGLDGGELDLVLYTGAEYKEHINWTGALKLQKELGARRAFGFDLHQTCTGTMLGLSVARAMMRSDPSLQKVLLAGGQRTAHVDYANPLTHFLLNTSSAGGAIVLRRGRGGLAELLESHVITDGTLCDDVLIPEGGSKHRAGDSPAIALRDPIKVGEYAAQNLIAETAACARRAIEKSGRRVADLRFLAGHHARIDHFLALLAALGLREEQSVYLEDHGHMGPVDVICALELGAKSGRLRAGDLAVCAGAGLAFSWAATALEWNAESYP